MDSVLHPLARNTKMFLVSSLWELDGVSGGITHESVGTLKDCSPKEFLTLTLLPTIFQNYH